MALNKWTQIKEELLARQQYLVTYFNEKVFNDEPVSEEFKDGLRIVTYLKVCLELINYPVKFGEACNKAEEINALLIEAEYYFDKTHISNLWTLVDAFEDTLEKNKEVTAWDYAHAILMESDPVGQDDESWIVHVFHRESENLD